MPATVAAAAQAAMAAMLNDISERTPLNCKGRRSRDFSIKNAVKISTASISGRPKLANRVRWTTAAAKASAAIENAMIAVRLDVRRTNSSAASTIPFEGEMVVTPRFSVNDIDR